MAFRRAAAVVAALCVGAAAFGAQPATVSAATDQLRESGVTTYELQPDRGVIHVTMSITLTNRAPSKTTHKTCRGVEVTPYGSIAYTYDCGTRTTYYYNWYQFYVERDATAFKVSADSGKVSLKPGKRDGDYRLVRATFTNLLYNKSRKLTVTYDLPAGGPRSTAARRAGWFYTNFCAVGPGTDSGALVVVLPEGFDIHPSRTMSSTVAGGKRTFTSGQITKEPWNFYACFRGTNDGGYAIAPAAAAGGTTVSIASWKEDTVWADAVRTAVENDLPKLVGVLGPLPAGKALTIREKLADGTAGDAYDPKSTTLNLSEGFATRAEVTHRLAGLWFDEDIVSGRWLTEGYAAWAEHEAGVSDAPCTKPGAYPNASQPNLGTWPTLGLTPAADQVAVLAYKRQAACYIISTVATALGDDRMDATMAAMRGDADPYASGEAAAPRAHRRLIWQEWLDLVELSGLVPAGADPDTAANLLATYGVTFDTKVLAAHAGARDAYLALVEDLGGAAPAVVDPLRSWDFETANAAMTAATTAATTTRSAAAVLDGISAVGGPVLTAVVAADDQADLDAAVSLAETQLSLAKDVADALAVERQPRDVVQEIGLIGTTLPPDSTAVEAVNRIDAATATSTATQIRALIGGARDAGIQRIVVAVAALAVLFTLLLIGAFLLRRRRRRHRAATPELVPEPAPGD